MEAHRLGEVADPGDLVGNACAGCEGCRMVASMHGHHAGHEGLQEPDGLIVAATLPQPEPEILGCAERSWMIGSQQAFKVGDQVFHQLRSVMRMPTEADIVRELLPD